MSGETKSVVTFLAFFMMFYFIHHSISSLGEIDLLAGKYKKEVLEQEIRYKKALKEIENVFGATDLSKGESVDNSTKILNKCCSEGESLDEFDKCEKNEPNLADWKPTDDFLVNRYRYFQHNNFTIPSDIMSIYLKINDFVLQIKNKKKRKLYIADILTMYPSEWFCIDGHKNNKRLYTLIFSPCRDHLCLQKCCPYDSVYNLQTSNCSKNLDAAQHIIGVALINGTSLLGPGVDCFLIYSDLSCEYYRLIHPNVIGTDRIFVQSNGAIFKKHKRSKSEQFLPTRYCIDSFWEGNTSLTNGFFCRKNSKKEKRKFGTASCVTLDPNIRGSLNSGKRCLLAHILLLMSTAIYHIF